MFFKGFDSTGFLSYSFIDLFMGLLFGFCGTEYLVCKLLRYLFGVVLSGFYRTRPLDVVLFNLGFISTRLCPSRTLGYFLLRVASGFSCTKLSNFTDFLFFILDEGLFLLLAAEFSLDLVTICSGSGSTEGRDSGGFKELTLAFGESDGFASLMVTTSAGLLMLSVWT